MGVQKSSYTKLLKLFFNLSIFSYSLYVVLLLFGYENGKFKISKYYSVKVLFFVALLCCKNSDQ